MGANTSRVKKVLVTNTQGVNTGTSVPTIIAGDVLLLDRSFTQVGDTDTAASKANADQLYVALGKGAGVAEFSSPIQIANIKKVSRQGYEAPVQHKVSVNASALKLAANIDYAIKVVTRNQHQTTANRNDEFFFYYKSGASVPTAGDVFAALAAKINGSKRPVPFTATSDADSLDISGKAVAANGINIYEFMYFDVALRSGFDAYVDGAKTVTAGKQGRGTASQLADMEQATKNVQRILWPIPASTNVAVAGSGQVYNLVTIEHNDVHTGDLQNTHSSPLTTIVAFASASNAPSAKETAFLEKLTSVLEATGSVYVSDIVPV